MKQITQFKRLLLAAVIFNIYFIANAQSFNSGSGTENDPYIIVNAEQLNNIRTSLKSNFKLGADIDLTEWLNQNSSTLGWLPIGSTSTNPTTPFSGVLDGDGHVISGIWIDRPTNNIGLFGYADSAVVKNVGLIINPVKSIRGNGAVGGIIGYINGGLAKVQILQCYVSGKIEANGQGAGSFVGQTSLSKGLLIKNCYSSGIVTAVNDAAGLVGFAYRSVSIQNSYSTCIVSATGANLAGIIADMGRGATGETATSEIISSIAINPSITGGANASRIAGYVRSASEGLNMTYTNVLAFENTRVNNLKVSGSATNKQGQNKTASELKDQNTYTGISWDFDNIWTMGNGEYQLPILKNLTLSKQPITKLEYLVNENIDFSDLVEVNGILDVKTCGAKGDGTTDETEILQKAIDACAAKHATVLFTTGRYYTRPLFLKSNVTVKVNEDATILGSTKLNDYKNVFPGASDIESSALIFGRDLENVTLTGNGVIDGQGGSSEFMLGNGVSGRPKLVHFVRCKNVTVENVTLKNSAFWTSHYLLCDGVTISGVKVIGHANWNNDGIDIDSKNVTITNCYVDSDDDGICMKSDRSTLCENVVVKNCTIRTNCNAIKLGTASKGGFKNIEYSDCVISRASEDYFRKWSSSSSFSWAGLTANRSVVAGIAIESVDGGVLQDVRVSRINMTDVQTPIFIRLGDRMRAYSTNISQLKDITITDITARAVTKIANSITGLPDGKVENVLIKNVTLNLTGGGTTSEANQYVSEAASSYPENRMFNVVLPAYGFYVRHANTVKFENIVMNLATPDMRQPYVFNDVVNYEITALKDISSENILVRQTNGKLLISLNNFGTFNFKLIKVDGTVVFNKIQNIETGNDIISIDAPKTGMYILLVQSKEATYSKKIVI